MTVPQLWYPREREREREREGQRERKREGGRERARKRGRECVREGAREGGTERDILCRFRCIFTSASCDDDVLTRAGATRFC